MKHIVHVTVAVVIEADSPLDLRMAMARLRKEAPHIDVTSAGHVAGFDGAWAKSGHDYSFSLQSHPRAVNIKKVKP